MSSSKEILLFRQILLNPVTCLQFQHFVSTKGDFLENDMVFWLEVQRYKVKKKKASKSDLRCLPYAVFSFLIFLEIVLSKAHTVPFLSPLLLPLVYAGPLSLPQ